MKRGTAEHPKVLSLMAELKIPLYSACGLLELLWHFAAKYCVQGDVGRFNDKAIAKALGWRGDAQKLLSALVECGWLDRDNAHRLLIHDWQDHADQTVQRVVAKRNLKMLAPCYDDASCTKTDSPRDASLPLPLPLPKAFALAAPPAGGNGDMVYPHDFLVFWSAYPKRKGKAEAFKAWGKVKARPPVEVLLPEIAKQSKTEQWTKDGGQFIPMPATWINNRRWEDESALILTPEQQSAHAIEDHFSD
jgi:hypothetical protein